MFSTANSNSVPSAHLMVKKYDEYCWECCGKETTLKCSKCIRSFHAECVTGQDTVDVRPPIDIENWCCSVCKTLENATNTQAELQRIPSIINTIERYIKYYAKIMKTIVKANVFVPNADIVNPIDLSTIIGKFNSYTSFDEFFVDLQLFVHNCQVSFTNNSEKTKRVKKLLELVAAEIESVMTCVQCHVNANEKETRYTWFTMVCDIPHVIIWVQQKNGQHWPAKVMSIDGQKVNVRFFGSDRLNDIVPSNRCFLYSENSPKKSQNSKSNDAKFKTAIKEASQYISNIREKYGSFQFVETKTPFDPSKYDDYVRDLMLGATTSHGPVKSRDENESDSDDPMGSMPENQTIISFKSEPSIAIDDESDIFDESSAGQFENDEEDTRGEFYPNENMDTDDDEPISSDNALNLNSVNVLEYKQSFKQFTIGFDRICNMNAELKQRLVDLEKKHELNVETNTKLMAEIEQLRNESKNQNDALNKTHAHETVQLKEGYQRQIEEQKQAMEQCKQKYSQLVEDAKKNKYCQGCGIAKPLDFYVCDMECQQRCLKRESN